MHNDKLGKPVNIVDIFLRMARELCFDVHSDESATGKQRVWDNLIDALSMWVRQWGTRFPTFPVHIS